MGYVDSHSHIASVEFEEDLDAVIRNIEENDIEEVMIVCADLREVEKAIALKEKDPRYKVAVGIHPEDAKNLTDDMWNTFITKAHYPQIDAIGEIGLDYYWDKDNKEEQKDLFIKQIEVAHELHKPILVHSRDAMQDTYDIMEAHQIKGVLHCYGGSAEMAKEFVKLGYLIAFGGVLTFKKSRVAREVVEAIDLKYLLTETDCPYMTPEPYRGKKNEPMYVQYVTKKIAEIKCVSEEEVQEAVKRNYLSLFEG